MTNANKDISESSAIMLPLFNPLCLSIDAATSTFSAPLFYHTLEGHPFLCTAATKVHALLQQDC